MSTAAAVEGAVAAKAGKKKLVVVLLVALLLLGAAGAGAMFWLKARADAALEAEEADDGEAPAVRTAARRNPQALPVFVPLDNFTVNLADRETDRYAQIGISLELRDAQAGEQIKLFMPAIRNNILMVLAHKRSSDLLEREGKETLAAEVLRETERALGLEPSPAGSPRRKSDGRPVRAVHFSNFIIQ